MPTMAGDGDGDDGLAYLVGGGSGSIDVAEQFFRRLKHHWNQGHNEFYPTCLLFKLLWLWDISYMMPTPRNDIGTLA